MSEAARLTLSVLGVALVFLTAMSLFFPEQVGQKIGDMTKLKLSKEGIDADFESAAKNYREAAKDGEDVPDEAQLRAELKAAAGSARIMWVDDNPENNRAVIALLRNLGHRIDVAHSNHDAVRYYSLAAYDLIISDISRSGPGESGNAGLMLPERLEAVRGGLPPLIYYVGRVDAPLTPDGQPVVNRPRELLRLIHVALDLETPRDLVGTAGAL